jgi:hypothetical protein
VFHKKAGVANGNISLTPHRAEKFSQFFRFFHYFSKNREKSPYFVCAPGYIGDIYGEGRRRYEVNWRFAVNDKGFSEFYVRISVSYRRRSGEREARSFRDFCAAAEKTCVHRTTYRKKSLVAIRVDNLAFNYWFGGDQCRDVRQAGAARKSRRTGLATFQLF